MARTPRLTRDQAVRMLGTGQQATAAVDDIFGPARAPRPRREADVPQAAPFSSVLGLDLALGTTGWCLIRDSPKGARPIAHGSFVLPGTARKDEGPAGLDERRFLALGEHVQQLYREHAPDYIAYEYPDKIGRGWWADQNRQPLTPYYLGIARGLLVAVLSAILAPDHVLPVPMGGAKRRVAGSPQASKERVRLCLESRHGWDVRGWTLDQTDAGAVALATVLGGHDE